MEATIKATPFPSALNWAWAHELPRNLRISSATPFSILSHRAKTVGKNACRGDHGRSMQEQMVRLDTNLGISGFGSCAADASAIQSLVGTDPFHWYRERGEPGCHPQLGRNTMALWDLAGKLLDRPAYVLMGGAGTRLVPVYDASIYFSDLMPGYASNYLDRFRAEIDWGLGQGYRCFKVKIGRGMRWMPWETGYRRDLEVLHCIRTHAGPGIEIGVDANNGYGVEYTKNFIREAGFEPAWMEEMFQENVGDCLSIKALMRAKGWKTLLTDGEGQGDPEAFLPLIAARSMDVIQADMRSFGIELILQVAQWAHAQGLLVAPHNWGSVIGFYMQLHMARAVPNFFRAECDPAGNGVVHANGYTIANGFATVPDTPGFGLDYPDGIVDGAIIGDPEPA
ncbi:MAG: enolase C-terminal domain-like protein [Methylacidiphilales bacterium]|nr:enolase C-terminal domain-like protein [Candidatus Methylacidiphilales bacterium]